MSDKLKDVLREFEIKKQPSVFDEILEIYGEKRELSSNIDDSNDDFATFDSNQNSSTSIVEDSFDSIFDDDNSNLYNPKYDNSNDDYNDDFSLLNSTQKQTTQKVENNDDDLSFFNSSFNYNNENPANINQNKTVQPIEDEFDLLFGDNSYPQTKVKNKSESQNHDNNSQQKVGGDDFEKLFNDETPKSKNTSVDDFDIFNL